MRFIDLHLDIANNYLAPAQCLASGLRTATPYAYELSGAHGRPDLFAADLPAMRAAGLAACVCSIHTPHVYDGLPLVRLLSQLERFLEQIERLDGIRVVLDARGLDEAMARGDVAVILGLENADVLHRDPYILKALYRLGIRSCIPAWYGRNCVCDAGHESEAAGLSSFGRRAVGLMAELGMLVDVSHMNRAGALECLEITGGAGVFASHANFAALHPSSRNIDDALVEALAAAGSLVGVCLLPKHLTATGIAGIGDVERHLRHGLERMGPGGVALGSDFDGTRDHVAGLERLEDIPALWNALAGNGMETQAIEGIAWRNAHAFLMRNL